MNSGRLTRALDGLITGARQHAATVDAARLRWSDRRSQRFHAETTQRISQEAARYEHVLEGLVEGVARQLRQLGE